MALNTTSTENSILARARTVVNRVYVSEHPNPASPVYPYVIVYFGAPIASTRDRHITSVRNNIQQAYVTFQVISENDDSARAVHNGLREKIIGFTPTDGGQMEGGAGMSYSRTANNNRPTLYYRESTYTYPCNFSWNA